MHWLRAGVSQSIMPSPFPSCTDSSSSDKVTVGRHNPSDRTTLAQEAVVLHLDGSGGGNSLDSAYPGGSSFSGVDLLPPGGAVEPHSVATEEKLLKGKGFSDLLVAIFLSCRKRETQAIYPKVWKRFNSWCTESSFNVRCSVAVFGISALRSRQRISPWHLERTDVRPERFPGKATSNRTLDS